MKTYDTLVSEPSNSCPAFCQLKQGNKHSCKGKSSHDKLLKNANGVVLLKSPKYDCSSTYPKSIMCVYSVSMPCRSRHVVVSHSELDLSEKDYVQVIHGRSDTYAPVTGPTWTLHFIPSTQFKVVFWSDRDEHQGKGFKLQFSCPPDIRTTSAPETTPQGSGDNPSLIP